MSINSLLAYSGNSGMGGIASSFASDVTRRISKTQGTEAATNVNAAEAVDTEQTAAQSEKTAQLQKLESALSGTVAYMAETHGEKAASALIGLVYKRIGNGEVNEESLGNAFLDVTRFIDKNFGTDKGDDFLDHLNGSLNDGMNAFFENGLNETFMVAPTGFEGGAQTGADELLASASEQYTESIKTMLEEMRAKSLEDQPSANSPVAAYANPWRENMMQGILADVMV